MIENMNGRWEPITRKGRADMQEMTRVTSMIELYDKGREMVVYEWWRHEGSVTQVKIWYRLPDNLRLCQFVPVQKAEA